MKKETWKFAVDKETPELKILNRWCYSCEIKTFDNANEAFKFLFEKMKYEICNALDSDVLDKYEYEDEIAYIVDKIYEIKMQWEKGKIERLDEWFDFGWTDIRFRIFGNANPTE